MCETCRETGSFVLHERGCVGYIGDDQCPCDDNIAREMGYKGFVKCEKCGEIIHANSNSAWAYAYTMIEDVKTDTIKSGTCPKCGNEQEYPHKISFDPPKRWEDELSTEKSDDDDLDV